MNFLALLTALLSALPVPRPVDQDRAPRFAERTVPRVDLERFQGRWFAVATKRTSPYQAGCRDGTQSVYRLRGGRGGPAIDGLNLCRGFDGRVTGDRIDVRIAEPRTNAVLYVTTYGGTRRRPNYLVAGLGRPGRHGARPDRYSWLLIDAPDRSEAWIMARDPRRTLDVLREAAPVAARRGIDPSTLRLEPQPGSDAVARGFDRETSVAELLAAAPPAAGPAGTTAARR